MGREGEREGRLKEDKGGKGRREGGREKRGGEKEYGERRKGEKGRGNETFFFLIVSEAFR